MIKQVVAIGENLNVASSSALVNVALEESGNFVGLVSREAGMMTKEFVSDSSDITSACRHTTSFAKKLKETLRLETGVPKLLFDFDVRMDEWRECSEQARVQYSEVLPGIVEVLGETLFETTALEKLEPLSARLEQQATDTCLRGMEMRTLRQRLSQYTSLAKQWSDSAKTNRQEFEAAMGGFLESIDLVFARREDRGLLVGTMDEGVPIRTLAVCEKISGEDGKAVVLSPRASPYQLRCENLRLYREGSDTLG